MTDEELNKIRKDESITHCYIKKSGVYYRPKGCGYTDYRVRAGVYTKEEAIRDAEHCRELWLTPIIKGDHNKAIIDEISDLLTRIIP